jgi:hypothetical protein
MKLQENIHRIHQMMGIIQESKMEKIFRTMIDEMGLYSAIKYIGGISSFQNLNGLDLISKEEKINFIKDCVNDDTNKQLYFGEKYIGYEDEIILSKSKNHRLAVKSLLPDKVFLHSYQLKNGKGIISVDYLTFTYENMSDEDITTIFIKLLEYM